MEIISVKEHEDGSATYTFDMTEQERNSLLQYALLMSLTEGAKLLVEKKLNELKSQIDLVNSGCGEFSVVHGSGEQSSQSGQQADGFKTSQVLG